MYWCNLKVAQSNGLHFYQTRSNANILYNTLLAVCIDKVVIRKSGEELYCKTYQSPTVPQRIVLQPNLHYGRQDTTSFDARTSFDLSSKHHKDSDGGTYNESCRGGIDFRIQGLLHSTVQEQDHTRTEAVKNLIHQFETHPNKEAFQADMKQNHTFNPSSEQSKETICSMGNMQYFEMCEIIPEVQCHICMTYWTKGIVYCTCGTCLRPSDKNRTLKKDRFDVLPIPNYVIKKGPSHGARRGNTERQRIYHAVSHLKRQRKRIRNPYWTDSRVAPVIENHRSTSYGPKNTAHAWIVQFFVASFL